MADSTIGGLQKATTIGDNDLFVLEQGGAAKKLKGKALTEYVDREILGVNVTGTVGYTQTPAASYDTDTRTLSMQLQRGPGISSIQKTGTSGKVDTYTVTTEDNNTNTFTVTNGDGLVNSVAGIAPETGTFDVDKFALMNLIYPVGSIYQSLLDSASDVVYPGSYFGGVWERIKDLFLLASGDTYATNAGTGGVAENTVNFGNGSAMFGFGDGTVVAMKSKIAQFTCDKMIAQPVADLVGTVDYATALAGTQTLDNLPPYKIVNMWRRVPGTAYTTISTSGSHVDGVWLQGKYIKLSTSSASVQTSANPSMSIFVPCQPGDKFVVCGRGGSAARLYAFLESDKTTVIGATRAASNVTYYNGVEITAPSSAGYLAVNVFYDGEPWALGKITASA